ncbi:tripartite motif-containing protein 6 [Cricetulus griseus]|uniref:RING-type E3 ubiquitin transferase n=1 Tax=Cricetulus griseus TaxID=10029 RepID=A0A061IEZ6_CRIGR|nr:tripartite motif-containing protein 6 [Cricetulus griseus]
MYIFLSMLASADVLLSTSTRPKTLANFWLGSRHISFNGCLTQMFFIHFLFVADSAVLLAMAFDRYVAICSPLKYTTILTRQVIGKIVAATLARSFIIMFPSIFLLKRLHYCRINVIEHTILFGGKHIPRYVHILLANLYVVIPPMLNPVIYGTVPGCPEATPPPPPAPPFCLDDSFGLDEESPGCKSSALIHATDFRLDSTSKNGLSVRAGQVGAKRVATMTSAVLVDIRDEVTCPICLELLTEPLSIDCGHSFCQDCITGSSDKSVPNQEGKNRCPVCRTAYQPENLRPNRHLAIIVKRFRGTVLGPGKQREVILCGLHGEKLQLFCKEDGKLICWLCERSQEHHGHHTFLMEEVAKDYQEMFQESLKKLRKEQQEAERLKALIQEKRESWKASRILLKGEPLVQQPVFSSLVLKNQVEPERHRIRTEFKHLRSILDREEQRELRKLEVEEKKGLSIIEKAEGDLIHQSQSLKDLISDLEHRCQGSTVELLQDVSDVTKRSEFWTLRKPQALPTKLKSLFRAPDLKKMLRVFRELTDVQNYWVDVTLNPQTANLNLVLSKNRRQVRFVGAKLSKPSCLEEHYDCSVLGSQHFSSGKYYWEVDVTKKTAWILGVCSNQVEPMFSFSQYPGKQSAYSRYQPQSGYWVIGLQHKHEYRAYEDSSTSLLLSMTVPPRRIGVFLDYEAGTVSFYNVTNHGLPIYTFSKYYFPTALCPYFNPCSCVVPMTLRRPSP